MLQIADITNERKDLLHLLDDAYESIYLPAFPDEDERESMDKFMQNLREEIPGERIIINILGDNLDDPETRVLKGIAISYYYEPENVGLLAYYAVASNTTERGLGKVLVQSAIESLKNVAEAHGKKLGGAFIEVNDPACVSADNDVMDPVKRVQIFESWGAKKVPINYVQPPVDADHAYCDRLMLMNYPVDGHYCQPQVIADLLRGMYRVYSLEKPPESDPYCLQMLKELRGLPVSALPDPTLAVIPGYLMNTPDFSAAVAPSFNAVARPRTMTAAAPLRQVATARAPR